MSVFEIPPVSSYLFCGWSIILHREYSQAAFLQQSPQRQITSRATPTLPSENVWGKLHSSAFRTCTVKRSICVQKIKFQRSQSVQMNGWKWWNTRGSWLWKSFDSESLRQQWFATASSLLIVDITVEQFRLIIGSLRSTVDGTGESRTGEICSWGTKTLRFGSWTGGASSKREGTEWLDLQNCTSWLLVFDFKFQSRWSSPRQYHSWLYDDCGTGQQASLQHSIIILFPQGHRVTWNSCVMLAPGPSLLSAVPRQFGPQYNVSGATWQLASSGPVIQSSSKIRAANLTNFVSHHSIPCPEQRKSPCKANASGRSWRRRTPERVIQTQCMWKFSWPVFSYESYKF